MKEQIAGFLGELAEELGWEPDLEEPRVRPEITEREKQAEKPAASTPVALTPDPAPQEGTPAIDRLRAELHQLRSTVKHLGAEVIQLRSQLAQLRDLPVPPDAEQPESNAPRTTAPEPAVLSPVAPST